MRNLQRLSDQELVTAYANGDNEAFDALLLRHKTRLFNYIFQMVRDRDLSDDIFQETFVKAITTIKQGRYNDMGKFSAWLYRIARNLVVDTFRAQRNEGSLSTDDTDYDILNRRELAEDTIEDVMVDLQIEERPAATYRRTSRRTARSTQPPILPRTVVQGNCRTHRRKHQHSPGTNEIRHPQPAPPRQRKIGVPHSLITVMPTA